MTVEEVYLVMLYAINNSINGDLSPAEFNRIIKLAEYSYINTLLGVPEEYRYDRPIPRINYSSNESVRQRLTPIIYGQTLTINGSGIVPYPENYIQTDAMYTSDNRKIVWASPDKLSAYLESTIDTIDDNPVYLIQKNQFQFYPVTIGTSIIYYVKTPTTMYYGFTENANGQQVYDVWTSFQPVWSGVDLMEVIVRALNIVGVNLQLPLLYQYAETIKKEGA